ncbi:MAG: M28 family peptidase [Longimicrobiales bacterium]
MEFAFRVVARWRVVVLSLALCGSALPNGRRAAAQQPFLLDAETRQLLHEALSGERAKDHVIQITRHHRIQGSRGFRDAANYVLASLRAAGFGGERAWIESFPSDGRVHYQTWQSPSGWHIEAAELRMVEPHAERIVGYPEIAMSVMTYSNAGEATAELVWVGPGTRPEDYAGRDVRDRFVLCTGYGGSVHRLAVLEHGAAGVVCYLDDERAQEYPDMLQYTGMWPLTEELERVRFGFNLTNRQGERLRALLESGERVVLHGRVEGPGLEPFFMDVPVAEIRGAERPDEVLVFSAHLDHPKESANDNASGSAALLDIARALRELIDAGRLPAPKRTLRFMWVPEWYGTMAYIDAHPELRGPALGGSVLANINMDMVGEHLELLHSRMILTRTPASIPSVLNDVVADMARLVDATEIRTPRGSLSAFNYRITPYSGGSDHMMFIERKIPGVMIVHDPDYTHHTSEDTPDKVDPVELERSELLATGALWYLANLESARAAELAWLAGANAAQRLALAARSAAALGDARDAQNRLAHALEWERATLESILSYNDDTEAESAVAAQVALLESQHAGLREQLLATLPRTAVASAADDARIPVRRTRGPLDFGLPASAVPAERAAWYASADNPIRGDIGFELVNFIDGRRSVREIRDALAAEFEPLPTAAVARYLEDLIAAGVLEWRR